MFVVFEGIDGSGKTTVSNQVAERLRVGGLSVKHLRAEGKFVSAVSEAIRDLGRDARNLELTPQAEFLLYVARDVQLIEEALRPALKLSDVVLADRFLYTAEILGRKGRHLPDSFTKPVLQAAAGGLEPDLVVLVDVDPVLARARRKAQKIAAADRRPPSRKGLSGVGLQHRLRRGYLELAQQNPDRWAVVDNEDSLEATVARVTELIQLTHAQGARPALERFRAASATRGQVAPLASKEDALAAFLDWVDLRLEREPRVAAYLLGGLYGPSIDERRRRLAERVPEAVLAALAGLTDDVSWTLRNELVGKHAAAVARTLVTIPNSDPRAAALRSALSAQFPDEVLMSSSRLDDEASWAVRERLYPQRPELVVGSLAGLDSARAWALRNDWLSKRLGDAALGYDTARVAAKSVNGLGGEAAWAIRERARSSAPVAALASLTLLSDEKSWRWRAEYLRLAPKVVMAGIKRSDHEKAWEMRRVVVNDCKEAIDSIQDLDGEPAWELREAHADTWPSTVVKSMGALADSGRGQALLRRQLTVHPANVSLLKHAAAVALGVHRVTVFDD
jgi:dTMP kinase